jgi:hypothetical protein
MSSTPAARRSLAFSGPAAKSLASGIEALSQYANSVERLSPEERAQAEGDVEKVVRTLGTLERRMEQVRQLLLATLGRVPSPEAKSTVQRMVRAGELLDSAAFAEKMGWTRQALSKALAAKRVFFVEEGGVRYYPAFFASKQHERRHVESVSKLMGDLPGGAKLQFFLTGKGSLNRATPLAALAKGHTAAVKAAAEGFAQG